MQALKPQQEKFWSKALPVIAGLATVHTLYAIPPFQSDRLEKKTTVPSCVLLQGQNGL